MTMVPTRVLLEKIREHGDDEFKSVLGAKPMEQMIQMGANRGHGHLETAGNLLVGMAHEKLFQHISLSWRQRQILLQVGPLLGGERARPCFQHHGSMPTNNHMDIDGLMPPVCSSPQLSPLPRYGQYVETRIFHRDLAKWSL